jgi:mono/diheme cytochrome c family protein
MKFGTPIVGITLGVAAAVVADAANAQMRDKKEKMTFTIPEADMAINKNLPEQVGAGRGDTNTVNSSLFIIKRDPFRAVRRGRQLFQRKFLDTQGQGTRDRAGNIVTDASIGAGIVDSCAGCHGRPRGAAGHGGDVFTRPDSRDAPHLFGLGLQEMLGDEITTSLRAIRDAIPLNCGTSCSASLTAKGISYGTITRISGTNTFNTSGVVGVNPDLRVRPFFAQGGTISIREFLVGAFNAEMGIQSDDTDLRNAALCRQSVRTPSGMVLNGATDSIEAPPVISNANLPSGCSVSANGVDPDGDGISNELPQSLVDFEEFYLLHYFKPATQITSDRSTEVSAGRALFAQIGCTSCHMPSLTINRDRRIADVETAIPTDPATPVNPFNRLFATASAFAINADGSFGATGFSFGDPTLPNVRTFANNPEFPASASQAARPFVVNNFFADLKRHNLGLNFAERNFDGSLQRLFMTEPLWGVQTTAPYGHDGRSATLEDVILRHATRAGATGQDASEADGAAQQFNALSRANKNLVLSFLSSLVLFSPDDVSSNLATANPANTTFPQRGKGAIALTVLFNNPADVE